MIVVALAFLFGLALGAGAAPAHSPNASESPLPALQGAQVSRDLWTAYLNRGTEGWASASSRRRSRAKTSPPPRTRSLVSFDALPLTVTPSDWTVLSPITVPPGHYVLAGPMTLLGPYVSFARVSDGGVGTLLGLAAQTTWNGVVWVDLGSVSAGRYAAVVALRPERNRLHKGARRRDKIQWGLGVVASGSP